MELKNKYGHCYYCLCDNCSMIYNLYINEKYRNKGHAKELIHKTIGEIRKEGYMKNINIVAAPLENSIDKYELIKFYKSMGLIVTDKTSHNK